MFLNREYVFGMGGEGTILTDHIVSQAPSCAHRVWMGFCKVLTMVPGTLEALHGVSYF